MLCNNQHNMKIRMTKGQKTVRLKWRELSTEYYWLRVHVHVGGMIKKADVRWIPPTFIYCDVFCVTSRTRPSRFSACNRVGPGDEARLWLQKTLAVNRWLIFVLSAAFSHSNVTQWGILHLPESFKALPYSHRAFRIKFVLIAHDQFSHLTTVDTGYFTHMTLGTRQVLGSPSVMETKEEPWDKARHIFNSMIDVYTLICAACVPFMLHVHLIEYNDIVTFLFAATKRTS